MRLLPNKERQKVLLNQFSEQGFDLLLRWFRVRDVRRAERRGEVLGHLWYKLDHKHRERAFTNLQMAYPEKSEAECRALAKEVFLHFGRVTGDFFRSPLRTNEEVLATTELEGQENVDAAYAMGRGIIVVTAHYGNWERFGHWCTATGRPISVVARDANQSGVQDRLQKLREVSGIEVLSRGNAARSMLGTLRKGGLVGLLADQNTDECFVPFFGKPAGTVLGPAVLHQRTKAILLPSYCTRLGPGKYQVNVWPMVDPEFSEADPVKITAELNAVLEAMIRRHPEQWLWMHDRWKESRLLGKL